jgi:diguanylate cyclase (GGDEF)-like protein/PAS domain S-box-containing protein
VTAVAVNGEDALASVASAAPDLILLDVMMPGMNGYEVAASLKADPATANVPIIMVTAQMDRRARLAGLNAGAEDFLTKPVERAELSTRVRNLLRLKAMADAHQERNWDLEEQVRARTAELQRFRSAMDATADAIWLINRRTMRIVEVNGTASKMLGYSREELLKLGPLELGSASLEQLESVYDRIIAGHSTSELMEVEIRCKDGSLLPVEIRRHAERSGDDWLIVGVLRDITDRRAVEERLHYLAHYDALTSLPNRTLLYETLRSTLAQAEASGWAVFVLFIDLDHFKNVNDTLGHAMGDELLVQVGNRLVNCLRVRDIVGRLGGDEFALILLLEDNDPGGAALVAEKIRTVMAEPFDLNGRTLNVTASIGITVHPDDASDTETLIKYADTAMYRAKQAGRDTFRFFTAQMNTELLARRDLEAALDEAIEREEFVLHYQPKVESRSGRITGAEALLRWERPGHGLVSPKDFIPVLEETGRIVDVGRWVIAAACKQIAEWKRSGIGPLQVSVNVSSRQFIERDLDVDVLSALRESGIPGRLLELELTEATLMANTLRTIESLQRLKQSGVKVSIDDFGTGYSSLAYLRRFPIDKLKIDIAFVRHIADSTDDAAIVLSIIRMAHSLKLSAVAEGVETAAQLAYLRHYGCDFIQGFYFSRPVPAPEFEKMFNEGRRLPAGDEEAQGRQQTLLLLDTEPDDLASLRSLFKNEGYRVVVAGSYAQGLELLALHDAQVIVADQGVGAMNGVAFLERAKELYPDSLRIMLSAHPAPAALEDAVNRAEVYRYYGKPWDESGLREGVREAFGRHSRLRTASEPARPSNGHAYYGRNNPARGDGKLTRLPAAMRAPNSSAGSGPA